MEKSSRVGKIAWCKCRTERSAPMCCEKTEKWEGS
jgi:hypothetical protein